ncbi:MAG TPA: hypothetical protein PK728_04730 [Bacillota bacterium]|nr:hypothetical protein [Bacillota bacterium]
MQRLVVFILIALLVLAVSPQCFAADEAINNTSGIPPVSPEEFTNRVNGIMDKLYTTASPITDTVAKLMLAVAGIAALVVFFSGMKLFQRVVGAVLCIGFGLLLFYGAPYIVGAIKGLAIYATK